MPAINPRLFLEMLYGDNPDNPDNQSKQLADIASKLGTGVKQQPNPVNTQGQEEGYLDPRCLSKPAKLPSYPHNSIYDRKNSSSANGQSLAINADTAPASSERSSTEAAEKGLKRKTEDAPIEDRKRARISTTPTQSVAIHADIAPASSERANTEAAGKGVKRKREDTPVESLKRARTNKTPGSNNTSGRRVSKYNLPGYPPRDTPLPPGVTLTGICQQYPNHLENEDVLDLFTPVFWTAIDIFNEATDDIKAGWTAAYGKGKTPTNFLQKRMLKRHEDLGKEAVCQLIAGPKPICNDQGTVVLGKSDPLNLGLNPLAVKKIKTEDKKPGRKERRRDNETVAAPTPGGGVQFAEGYTHAETRFGAAILSEQEFNVQFNQHVRIFPTPHEPLGCFWGLPFWESDAQFQAFYQAFESKMRDSLESARLVVDIDPTTHSSPAWMYFENALDLSGWSLELRKMFFAAYDAEFYRLLEHGITPFQNEKDVWMNSAFFAAFEKCVPEYLGLWLLYTLRVAMSTSPVHAQNAGFRQSDFNGDLLAYARDCSVGTMNWEWLMLQEQLIQSLAPPPPAQSMSIAPVQGTIIDTNSVRDNAQQPLGPPRGQKRGHDFEKPSAKRRPVGGQ
ncbi:hypothetical protein LTR10_013602 [Elasticomyces elasticus]|uniref:Uncharacterized protein n=1 Tax=Exophiala sideris TaxID=1016849 RepID=A0ABR0JQM8_9EURO|nr:hypothetical protein LTR10_013602 [Elasticomyces elasticus]KAK5039741.1 hypothetical protein LTS07_000236 [Exophiala sideris]KAK5041293.1 hypothetical protein LTR13_002768 [Exophiala sideris]KAK5068119.1 hypothetical protein LTR69_000237 [Exophiala sideris]KAK5187420.1 hypothetical protein LTR44_000236 [Eurotiomycetes sp. CCFEE 6388]